MNTLTVRETVRVAGRRTPEEHEQDYQSVDELRRATGGPGVLRAYTLAVSSWGKEKRARSASARTAAAAPRRSR